MDLSLRHVVHREELHSRSKITAFDGEELTGAPVYTILRGNIIMDHGALCGAPTGIFLN